MMRAGIYLTEFWGDSITKQPLGLNLLRLHWGTWDVRAECLGCDMVQDFGYHRLHLRTSQTWQEVP